MSSCWSGCLPSPHERIRRLLSGRGGDVNTWFVSTVNRLPGEQQFSFIWSMEEFESEIAARRYAKDALNKGLRVEAGTLPGPQVHVPWPKAAAWAASGETGPQSAG